jgi:hypothetical protein
VNAVRRQKENPDHACKQTDGGFARQWWLMSVILATPRGKDQGDHGSKPAGLIVQEILSQKYPTQNRASGVAQGVECLP